MKKNYQFWIVMVTVWVAIYLFYSHKTSLETLPRVRKDAVLSRNRSSNSSDEDSDSVSSATVVKNRLQTPNPPPPVVPTLNQGNTPIDLNENASQYDTYSPSGNDGPDLKNIEDDYSNQLNSDLNGLNSNINVNSDIGNSDFGASDVEGR